MLGSSAATAKLARARGSNEPGVGGRNEQKNAEHSSIDDERPGGEPLKDAHQRPDRGERRNGRDNQADRQNGPAMQIEMSFVQLP